MYKKCMIILFKLIIKAVDYKYIFYRVQVYSVHLYSVHCTQNICTVPFYNPHSLLVTTIFILTKITFD